LEIASATPATSYSIHQTAGRELDLQAGLEAEQLSVESSRARAMSVTGWKTKAISFILDAHGRWLIGWAPRLQ
jgi:hypothetical protein